MRHTRQLIAGTALAAALVGTAAPAFAYDCYNASRSTTGATQAGTNSGNWWTVPEFLSVVGVPQDKLPAVMAIVDNDPLIPANYVVFYNPAHPMELASNQPLANAVNGVGIDHSDANGVMDELFFDVSQVPGAIPGS